MNFKLDLDHETLRVGKLSITFQRTLRLPDDGRKYPLPPGLGCFPLRSVDDYRDRVPADWREHGGVFLPMYQREAMWISFGVSGETPHAVKVAVGKICALTGKPWTEGLHRDPQDFLVTPPQPWLDGIASGGKGLIRQFVAMPLGMGYTVEGQVSGEERFGGIQLKVFAPRPGLFPERQAREDDDADCRCAEEALFCCAPSPAPFGVTSRSLSRRRAGAMGLGAGGKMKQKIYSDPHGLATWDEQQSGRLFVHIVNSELWREITGEAPPESPVTAREYANHDLPWFDLYDEGAPTLSSQSTLDQVRSIKQMDQQQCTLPLQDDEPVKVGPVKKLWNHLAGGLRDGDW